MPSAELFLREPNAGRAVRLAADDTISLSSDRAGWVGLAVERQRLPGCTAEGFMPWHLLSMQIVPPVRYEDGERGTVPALSPGDVVIRPAGVVTAGRWTGTVDVINLALDPAALRRVATELTGEPADLADSHFGPDPRVRFLALTLEQELAAARSGPVAQLFVESVRTALAAHLVERYARPAQPAVADPGVLSERDLARVRERVEAGIDGQLLVADLAATVALSPFHFSRLFTAATGWTPHRYVLHRRIERAKLLLARPGVTVREVARRTGFADAGHLARHFRRQVGTSPGRYAAAVRTPVRTWPPDEPTARSGTRRERPVR